MSDDRNIRMFVILAGEWSEVCSAFNTGDEHSALLRQMPHDEDDAQYGTYRLEASTHKKLMELLTTAANCRVTAHIGIQINDAGIEGWAETNDAWSRNGAFAHFKSCVGVKQDSVIQRDFDRLKIEYGDFQADATNRIQQLEWQITQLSMALKKARTWAREQKHTTTREFSNICGVTPTQMSLWTAWDMIDGGEPDFKD